MPCTVENVKSILLITNNDDNTEIADCIDKAKAHAIKRMQTLGADGYPDDNAVAHYAAWLFRQRRDPAGVEAFKATADTLLDASVQADKEIDVRRG
jgi:hypothetical protein